MRVVLMGPPGVRQGPQAGTVANLVGVAYVGSGDLFREAARNGTELGQRAKPYMDRGGNRPRRPYDRHGDRLSEARVSSSTGSPAASARLRRSTIRWRAWAVRWTASSTSKCARCFVACRAAGSAAIATPATTPSLARRRRPGVWRRWRAVPARRRSWETARRGSEVYFGETVRCSPTTELHQILVEVNGDQPIADVTRSLREAFREITARCDILPVWAAARAAAAARSAGCHPTTGARL